VVVVVLLVFFIPPLGFFVVLTSFTFTVGFAGFVGMVCSSQQAFAACRFT